jgi:hypothetical protein
MATTEELSVLIKTVADTSGAQQVQRSLNQLTAQQQVANTVLRQSMAQVPQTLAAFQAQARAVEQQVGARPTLLPEDLGIKAAEAAVATKAVGEAANITGGEVVRLGAAFVGFGVGLSAFTTAGMVAHQALQSIVTDTLALDQAQRANTLALGQSAASFQIWAQTVAQQAGVTQQSVLQAGTAAAQLGRPAGFGPEQVTAMSALATVLAQIRGSDPSETMNLLTAAMQGNQQAAQSLGLQVDAATLSFRNFGDPTGEVFRSLDEGTQITLRTQAAFGQLHDQLQLGIGPAQELHKAQSDLNTQWTDFAQSIGPGAIEALAGIVGGADKAAAAIRRLNEITLERNRQAVGDEGFRNEAAALDALGQKLNEILPDLGKPIQDAREQLGDLGKPIQDANNALRDATGFDVAATALDGLANAGEAAGQALDTLSGPLRAAQQIAAQYADQQQQVAAAAQAQQQALQAQIAAPAAARAAAQQNEAAAIEELMRRQQDMVNLAADEARIRLEMLPTSERMLELTNQASQAQVRAQQATVGTSRAAEDLQNAIRLQTLIAQSPDRSMAARQAALASAVGLTRQMPETQIAALQAQMGALPAQRALEDVQRQAQLQGLQLQQALFAPEYQRQQDALVSVVADAAKQAATRDIAFDVKAINVILQGTGATLTDTDYQQIVGLAGQAVADAIHSAVQTVDRRGASSQLLGASTG